MLLFISRAAFSQAFTITKFKQGGQTHGLPSLAMLKAMSGLLMSSIELASMPVLARAEGSQEAATKAANWNSDNFMLKLVTEGSGWLLRGAGQPRGVGPTIFIHAADALFGKLDGHSLSLGYLATAIYLKSAIGEELGNGGVDPGGVMRALRYSQYI